jgi:hypothetical protein
LPVVAKSKMSFKLFEIDTRLTGIGFVTQAIFLTRCKGQILVPRFDQELIFGASHSAGLGPLCRIWRHRVSLGDITRVSVAPHRTAANTPKDYKTRPHLGGGHLKAT